MEEVLGVSDLAGVMQWRKFADAEQKQYAGGFKVQLALIGSRFSPKAKNVRLLDELVNAEPNAVVSLIGPSLQAYAGQEVERVLSWQPNNKLVHYGPQTFSGMVSNTTGQMSGSFTDKVDGVTLKFTGMVFQKQGLAAGGFLQGDQSGNGFCLSGSGGCGVGAFG